MTLNEAFEAYRSSPTEANLELLYPKIRERVIGVLRWRMAEDPDEALVVSITTDVVLAIPKFNVEGPAEFSTWMERKVRNQAVDEGRRRKRAPLSLFDQDNVPIKSLVSKDDPSFGVLLREIFEQLDSDEQALLAGKLENAPSRELAEKLQVTINAVDLRWMGLKEKVRKILDVSNV